MVCAADVLTLTISLLSVVRFQVQAFTTPSTEKWGPWSDWSPCTAKCGPGVQDRSRNCRKYGACPAENEIQSRACQPQPCSDSQPSFRQTVCSKYDKRMFSGKKYTWEPFIHSTNPCKVSCRAKGLNFYANLASRARDGELCSRQGQSKSICYRGVCKPVGCDDVIMSDARLDKCGMCNGDGTGCRTVTGTFEEGKQSRGVHHIITLPTGTTSINITELSPSENHLLLQTDSGKVFINTGPEKPPSGLIRAAGTSFQYSGKTSINPKESIVAKGPTNCTIHVKILLRGRNAGVAYNLSVPNDADLSLIEDSHRNNLKTPKINTSPLVVKEKPLLLKEEGNEKSALSGAEADNIYIQGNQAKDASEEHEGETFDEDGNSSTQSDDQMDEDKGNPVQEKYNSNDSVEPNSDKLGISEAEKFRPSSEDGKERVILNNNEEEKLQLSQESSISDGDNEDDDDSGDDQDNDDDDDDDDDDSGNSSLDESTDSDIDYEENGDMIEFDDEDELYDDDELEEGEEYDEEKDFEDDGNGNVDVYEDDSETDYDMSEEEKEITEKVDSERDIESGKHSSLSDSTRNIILNDDDDGDDDDDDDDNTDEEEDVNEMDTRTIYPSSSVQPTVVPRFVSKIGSRQSQKPRRFKIPKFSKSFTFASRYGKSSLKKQKEETLRRVGQGSTYPYKSRLSSTNTKTAAKTTTTKKPSSRWQNSRIGINKQDSNIYDAVGYNNNNYRYLESKPTTTRDHTYHELERKRQNEQKRLENQRQARIYERDEMMRKRMEDYQRRLRKHREMVLQRWKQEAQKFGSVVTDQKKSLFESPKRVQNQVQPSLVNSEAKIKPLPRQPPPSSTFKKSVVVIPAYYNEGPNAGEKQTVSNVPPVKTSSPKENDLLDEFQTDSQEDLVNSSPSVKPFEAGHVSHTQSGHDESTQSNEYNEQSTRRVISKVKDIQTPKNPNHAMGQESKTRVDKDDDQIPRTVIPRVKNIRRPVYTKQEANDDTTRRVIPKAKDTRRPVEPHPTQTKRVLTGIYGDNDQTPISIIPIAEENQTPVNTIPSQTHRNIIPRVAGTLEPVDPSEIPKRFREGKTHNLVINSRRKISFRKPSKPTYIPNERGTYISALSGGDVTEEGDATVAHPQPEGLNPTKVEIPSPVDSSNQPSVIPRQKEANNNPKNYKVLKPVVIFPNKEDAIDSAPVIPPQRETNNPNRVEKLQTVDVVPHRGNSLDGQSVIPRQKETTDRLNNVEAPKAVHVIPHRVDATNGASTIPRERETDSLNRVVEPQPVDVIPNRLDSRNVPSVIPRQRETGDNPPLHLLKTEDEVRTSYPNNEWRISGLTECTHSCGGGVQQTVVVCVDTKTQAVVTDENCHQVRRPKVKAVSCNKQPCPAKWVPGKWTPCSVSCGDGEQTRAVTCLARVSPTLDQIMPDSSCASSESPVTRQNCNPQPCSAWSVGNWSECSADCDDGVKTRDVRCLGTNQEVLEDENCKSLKPDTEEKCNLGTCGKGWLYTDWPKKCPVSCGSGTLVRKVLCAGDDGHILPEGRCNVKLKPQVSKRCKVDIPCGGIWFTGEWSKCDAACGNSIRTREVLCVKSLRGDISVVVGEENCAGREKPMTEEVCKQHKCRPVWFMTSWGECSKSCETGYKTREIRCLGTTHHNSDQCSPQEKPTTRMSCNTHACRRKPPVQKGGKDGDDCKDLFSQCRIVKRARLCRYSFYKSKCCKSCL